MKYLRIAVAGILVFSSSAYAGRSQSESMSFNECLQRIRSVATQFGVAPINIVETNDIRMVRIPTSDGSVLITCSRPDHKMVVTMGSK